MVKNKLNTKKTVHLVGIGGIGLSSLARYFLSEGFLVSGSDVSPQLELEKLGVLFFLGHKKENLPQNTSLLVYSNAILNNNPELLEAKKNGVKTQSYPEVIGEITKKYFTIAVSGTHGKSTTTAMLSLIMIKAGLDPTVIIGTKLKEFNNTNFRKGNSKYFLLEADEFKAAFLNYYPKIAVITNIEEDHLDFYKNLKNITDTFKKYVRNNVGENTLILNDDDKNSKKLKEVVGGKLKTYSLLSENYQKIDLSVYGKHNQYNAQAAFSVALELGIKESVATKALSEFQGSWRRFEEKKVVFKNGIQGIIINDYAHHPTEIKATIDAVKEKYQNKRIILVFQPHQYERTYRLFDQFKKVLSEIEVSSLFITDIYTVEGRESKEILKKVNAEMLAKRVAHSLYTGNLQKTGQYLLNNLQGNEMVVIMGAGDVYSLEGYITKGLKEN
jgi:UDP-N-acetylmuramate--alanine ligase